MRKSKGQSLLEFVGIAILAVGIIILGLYKFGDKLSDFFAGNTPDSKFNASRTVRFENPSDLVSNVTVQFGSLAIKPPVEKIIKDGLANGNYIQTSGSAGRIEQMGEIIKEYSTQIQNIIGSISTGSTEELAFTQALSYYVGGDGTNPGVGDFLDAYNSYSSDQLLEKKLKMLEMAVSIGSTNLLEENLQTAADNYIPPLSNGNGKDIIQTFTNDMLNLGKGLDYFIDPTLYTSYLNQEKRDGDVQQDKDLISAIQAALGSMTSEQKLSVAGLIKVYYGNSYSRISSKAYNGAAMCKHFNGILNSDHTKCTILVN